MIAGSPSGQILSLTNLAEKTQIVHSHLVEGLRPLLPILVEAMEQHGHLQLVPEVRARLLAISAATIDRALRDIRPRAGTATRRRSPPSAAIRRSVAVRTFDGWDDPAPGFVEVGL